jgi:hypothetical protein
MASASDLSDKLSAQFSPHTRASNFPDKSVNSRKTNGAHWLDRLGIVLSVICAVHCALTPVLVAVAPLLFTAEFEWRTKVVLVALASVAIVVGFISHRSWTPIGWLGLALGLLTLGHLCESWSAFSGGAALEIVATVLASGALIMAHLANLRACRTRAPHGH